MDVLINNNHITAKKKKIPLFSMFVIMRKKQNPDLWNSNHIYPSLSSSSSSLLYDEWQICEMNEWMNNVIC